MLQLSRVLYVNYLKPVCLGEYQDTSFSEKKYQFALSAF